MTRTESPEERTARILRTQALHCERLGSALYAGLLRHAGDDLLAGGLDRRRAGGSPGRPWAQRARAADARRRARPGTDRAGRRPGGLLPVGRRNSGSGRRRRAGLAGAARAARRTAGGDQDMAGASTADQRGGQGRRARRSALPPGRGGRPSGAAGRDRDERRPQPPRRPVPDHRRGGQLRAGDSPVRMPGAWRGTPPPAGKPQVVSRIGGDLAPVDPLSEHGSLLLLGYVWADQVERFERLRGAFELAARVPAELRREAASQTIAAITLEPGPGPCSGTRFSSSTWTPNRSRR